MKNPDYIDQILEQGAERARAIAEATLAEIGEAMGLLRP